MKTMHKLFSSNVLTSKVGTYLAATATVAMLAAGVSALHTRAHARQSIDRDGLKELNETYQKAQLFEIDQLEVGFHRAGSYGGDIDAMMELWADDCTLTSGTTVFSGKDAVRALFASGGAFTHYWVGLTPAFKLTVDVHGDTADLSFQCDYVDPNTTPATVQAERVLFGVVKKVHGNWQFWHMTSAPASL